MFPTLSRRPRGSKGRERSPFSSPYSNIQASPIAARRTSLEERRRPAAKFDHILSPGPEDRIEEEGQDEEDGEDEDQDEDINEDEAGELSPLLPIFSAAHLGNSYLASRLSVFANPRDRCLASLQSYSYHTSACGTSVRDYPFMGSATVTSGVAIPCQAYTTADTGLALFQSYLICTYGQLPAV